MARVMLAIGDNQFPVACRDGEEARLTMLGKMLADRWPGAQKAAGNAGAMRVLLLTALMLADELADATAAAVPPQPSDAATLDRLAARLETLADALEEIVPNA